MWKIIIPVKRQEFLAITKIWKSQCLKIRLKMQWTC